MSTGLGGASLWHRLRKRIRFRAKGSVHRLEPGLPAAVEFHPEELGLILDHQGKVLQYSSRLSRLLAAAQLRQPVAFNQIIMHSFSWSGESPAHWPAELPLMRFKGIHDAELHLGGWVFPESNVWRVRLTDFTVPMKHLLQLERRNDLMDFSQKYAQSIRHASRIIDHLIDEWLQGIALRLGIAWMAIAMDEGDGWQVIHTFTRPDYGKAGDPFSPRDIHSELAHPLQCQAMDGEDIWIVPHLNREGPSLRLYCGRYCAANDESWFRTTHWKQLFDPVATAIIIQLRRHRVASERLRQQSIEQLLNGGQWEYDVETDVLRIGGDFFQRAGLNTALAQGVILQQWLHYVMPQDREEFQLKLRLAVTQPIAHNLRLIIDGESRWFRFLGTKASGQDHRIIGFAHDIHAMRERESEAEAAKARLEALVDSVPGVIYVQRYDEGEFHSSFCSASVEQLLGITAETLAEMKYYSLIHPADLEVYGQRSRTLLQQGRSSHQYRVRHHSGNYRWVQDDVMLLRDDRGMPVEAVGVWFDITDLKEASERIAESEERYRALVEDSPVIIYRYHPDLTVVFANEVMKDALGIGPAQGVPWNLADYLSPEECSKLYARLAALTPEQPFVNSETWIRLSEYDLRCWVLYERAVFDQNRKLLEVQAVASDTTEVHEARRVMLQSAKMATLGEMATGLAHEINQPLNVIHMSLTNLLCRIEKSGVDPDYITNKMERIKGQVDRVARLVDHMRVFGRQSDLEGVAFNPNEALRGALSMVEEQLSKEGIILEVSEDILPDIVGHPDRLEQVLINLLMNARYSTLEAQKLNSSLDPRIQVYGYISRGEVTLCVEDNGYGISDEIIDRIFEPFFTTKPVGQGTGLGLAVSYAIVRQMSGRLQVENLDGGVVFKVIIPVVSPQIQHG